MIKEIKERIFGNSYKKISYSQCGEDLIVDFALSSLKIKNPDYLDIGAHHPIQMSNTYLLYTHGFRGVCVEPDPILFNEIKKTRKKDTCLNIGVSNKSNGIADFYVMSSKSLNTFSKQVAEGYQNNGNQKIEKIIQIPLKDINEVVEENFEKFPHFVSLDVEGLEIEILNKFDFNEYSPEIFCIETLTFSESKSEEKIVEINTIMKENGYFVYADTFINTIFIRKESWQSR